MKQLRMTWRWWAKALGQKASKKDHEADKVAVIRTFIFTTYLVTNCFIVAGVIKHWNDYQPIYIQIDETSKLSETAYSNGRYSLGMGRDTRTNSIYRTTKVKNRTGEFE